MRWVVLLLCFGAARASADDAQRVRVKHRARVFAEPGGRGRLGTLGKDAELDVVKTTAVHGHRWIELAPRGWVDAADVGPATGEPPTPGPQLRFAAVRDDGADAYEHASEIEQGEPTKHWREHTYVVVKEGRKAFPVHGTMYIKTDLGYIAERDLEWLEPSAWEGLPLAPGDALDMAWAVARKAGKTIAVHDTPSASAPVLRELERRTQVKTVEEHGGWVKIDGGGWIDAVELRQPRVVARPDGVAEGEKWIDVDLDEQVLIAYEGDTPVFVTLVSSGVAHSTPTGIYRIRGKDVRTRMTSPPEVKDEWGWNVAEVPFSMRFRKNYALHGAYWHDGFGRERSQGCVNLSPKDAERLFNWVTPDAPSGWTSAEAENGTAVRIHSKRDPAPRWLPYR